MTDSPSGPALGDVWSYPFLWSRESARGETEGRKHRPCALALLLRAAEGETEILLVPITSQPPGDDRVAVEIPEIEKRRAGLDKHLPLWVIVDEFNSDLPSRSFYFEPGGRIGTFGSHFIKTVQRAMVEAIKARKAKRVRRR